MRSATLLARAVPALLAVTFGAAFAGVYLVLPTDTARAIAWVVAGTMAAVAMVLASHRATGRDHVPAWLLATGTSLLSVAQAMTLVDPGSPSYADAPGLLAYPVLAAAVITFQRDRVRRDQDSLLDTLVVTVAAAQAGWLVLIEPLLSGDELGMTATLVSGAYPLGHLLVLAVAVRFGFAMMGSADSAARLLLAGLLVGVGSGLVAELIARPLAAAGWFIALALLIAAVRDPAMARVAPAAVGPRSSGAWPVVVLLALACLVSPLLVITHPVDQGAVEAAVVLGGAVLLFALALLRIVSLLNQLRRALRREHVLRTATGSLVSATDRGGVRDAALRAAVDLLHQPGSRSWQVDGDPGGTVAQASEDAEQATFLDSTELAFFPTADLGITTLAGPTLLHATLGVPSASTLVLVGLPPRGAAREGAVIALARPPSARTISALQSLASTMTLALDRLDVGEILVERRSERRLRLMLRHASDVICILDHDLTVVHVSAAVEPIIGLPAPELLGMNWLDLLTEDDREAGRDLVSLAQGGRPARGELRLSTADGRARHVDTVVSEVIDEDLMGFVVTCHDITARHELEQQLTHQAFHDALTGLANRALFRDRLGHAMARARRAGDYGVLFIDLDDFKTVNDSLGHAAGDDLLREMTVRLRTCLRDGDTAARLGGDEFAILLEDVDDDNHCIEIARRILAAFALPFVIGGSEVTTGASIGIAVGHLTTATPEDLMRNADLALYEAKNAGKNRYAVYASAMHDAALARLSLTSDLRHALERDEFVVYYQPLVALASSKIIGLEALVRWEHPERGLLSPAQFIPLAEETGLIVALGRLVLQKALSETVRWQRSHGRTDLHIAVNVSGRQLQDPCIVDDVRDALYTTGIDPATVILEITETVLLPGDGAIVERLHTLAGLGVHLYIDDFGTGYSSLAYLQTLPVNGLKLAQEFVAALPGTVSDSRLVNSIRDLAGALGLDSVVAEGIERPEQWEALLSMGYSVGQGYHLAVPMPAAHVLGYLTGTGRPGDGAWERDTGRELPQGSVVA